MSKHAGGAHGSKYSPDFKRTAVERILGGESLTAVARELGIRRKFLYAWKAAGKASQATPPLREKETTMGRNIRSRKRISELEQLTERQTAELDFFAAALRSQRLLSPKLVCLISLRRPSGCPEADCPEADPISPALAGP